MCLSNTVILDYIRYAKAQYFVGFIEFDLIYYRRDMSGLDYSISIRIVAIYGDELTLLNVMIFIVYNQNCSFVHL